MAAVEDEHAAGSSSCRSTIPHGRDQVGRASSAAAGDDGDVNTLCDGSHQIDVVALHRSIAIDRVQKQLARAQP